MKKIFRPVKTFGLVLIVLFSACKKEETNLPPKINDQSFTIDENSPNGTVVGQILAIDAESELLTYAIVGGNVNEAFSISINQGEIAVQNEDAIDYETNPSFTLVVEVTDEKGEFATATIDIQLNDIVESIEGLIFHLPFNGNAEDESSNGFDGTVHGAIPALDRYGNENSAYFFDGIDDYIELGDMDQFSFPSKMNFTISLWAEVVSFDRNQTFISKYFSSSNHREYVLSYKTNSDSYNFIIYDGGLSDDRITFKQELGWHHIICMKDNEKIYLYIDNKLVSEKAYSTNQLGSFARLLIGALDRSNTSPDEFFHGSIDDVMMYNRALNLEEINALFYE